MNEREFELADADATEALGQALAQAALPPAIVFLYGDLGAGKTTLTRALLRALGHGGAVPSPTYTLVEVYDLPAVRCVHCDFYRVAGAEEIEYLGISEWLGEHSLLLIEWPEHGAEALWQPDLRIELAYRGAGRAAKLLAETDQGRRWIRQIP